MMSYADAKIYKLVFTGTTDCYIGSTTVSLNLRLSHHKHQALHPDKQKQTTACHYIQTHSGVAIELVEEFPCDTKEQLNIRERYWIENTPNTVNKNLPGQSWKERAIKRKDIIKEYMTTFRAERYTCVCGKEIGKAEKARHERSAFHRTHLNT